MNLLIVGNSTGQLAWFPWEIKGRRKKEKEGEEAEEEKKRKRRGRWGLEGEGDCIRLKLNRKSRQQMWSK